ncbi:MAG: triose-phosphate isomerase [Ketobacteraceae bacterium]|nr:triose-phosphate isomerase [Ketobacteraceae bacterium]
MRTPIVAGNWKMNGSRGAVEDLVSGIRDQLDAALIAEGPAAGQGKTQVILCPPAIYIPQVCAAVDGSALAVGAQNAAAQEKGAYTGEISPAFLADFGVHHVILGHSERRQLFNESDQLVAEKFALAQKLGLIPVLCVGETRAERESDQTIAVVTRQLQAVIDKVGVAAFGSAIVAYEPVWAIGTGLTATPEQAQEVHRNIRELISSQDASVGDGVRLLYGGSVKAANAEELFRCPDIDGGLIGGASLDPSEFVAICQAAVK